MLKGLLSKSVCGECRICCGFDSTDVWEMPVMNEETKTSWKLLDRVRNLSGLKFVYYKVRRTFR